MMGIRLFAIGALLGAAACGPKTLNGNEPDGGLTPVCDPGASELCYSGPAGTEGVGPCKGGERFCDDFGQWSPCQGEVLPAGEVCANGVDDNCNGQVDEDVDLDGDGFTTCGGDCCDSTNDGCATPELVNPGAFDAAGNNLDDDCDGQVDNVIGATCDSGLPNGTGAPNDYAHAMDICDATATSWGLVDAKLFLADGTGAPLPQQHAVRPAFGATVTQSGAAFAVLSTGNAATPTQTNPGYLNFQTGGELNTSSPFPADFIAAHGGTIPNSPGCPALLAGSVARDPVMLQLKIRAPTNAKSFSFSMNFMSSEYPEWTCSPFNDFFVVLLDSTYNGTPANPVDKNLAFYQNGANVQFPVGVNLAAGDTGLFTVCKNGAYGCTSGPNGGVDGTIATCISDAELANTGMDQVNPPANPLATGNPGSCGTNNLLGGGTGWLTTSGNIVGGEVFTLRIALWDTSDGLYDSIAIIDNFQWSVEVSQPGTVLQKPKQH
jgi:hypothetical protein